MGVEVCAPELLAAKSCASAGTLHTLACQMQLAKTGGHCRLRYLHTTQWPRNGLDQMYRQAGKETRASTNRTGSCVSVWPHSNVYAGTVYVCPVSSMAPLQCNSTVTW